MDSLPSQSNNTDYATVDELRPRVAFQSTEPSAETLGVLQMVLNASAYVVDRVSRMPPAGQIAFSETEEASRFFDGPLNGVLCIDDATNVNTIQVNGEDVSYNLAPYNETPSTAIIFDAGYSGVKIVEVVATWGYCSSDNRPAVIKEATLVQAKCLYEKIGLTAADQIAMQAMENPYAFVDGYVLMMLLPLQRPEAAKMYKQRKTIIKQAAS